MSQPTSGETNNFFFYVLLLALLGAFFGYIVGKDDRQSHLINQPKQIHQVQPEVENKFR